MVSHGKFQRNKRYIYVISNAHVNNCKIGTSINPLARLTQLQTGSHSLLTLKYTLKVDSQLANITEKFVHARLTNYRMVGEWFSICTERAITCIVNEALFIDDFRETHHRLPCNVHEVGSHTLNNFDSIFSFRSQRY